MSSLPHHPPRRGALLARLGPLTLVLLAVLPAPAAAQGGAPAPGPIPEYRARDGQGWATPTALTAPRGTFTLSLYELIFPMFGYSPADALELGVGGLTDFVDDGILVARAKLRLYSSPGGRFHAALLGVFTHARFDFVDTRGGGTAGGAGAVVSVADGPEGKILASAFGFTASAEPENVIFGGNARVTLAGPFRLVAEVFSTGELEGAAVSLLGRVAFRRFAAEAGAMIFTDDGSAGPIGTLAFALP